MAISIIWVCVVAYLIVAGWLLNNALAPNNKRANMQAVAMGVQMCAGIIALLSICLHV